MSWFFPKYESRGFNYTPRYYDPDKEALERKKAEMGLDSKLSEEEKLRIRLRSRWGRGGSSGNKSEGYNKMRTIFIVAFCCIAFYVLFFTPVVEDFISMFLKLGGK